MFSVPPEEDAIQHFQKWRFWRNGLNLRHFGQMVVDVMAPPYGNIMKYTVYILYPMRGKGEQKWRVA